MDISLDLECDEILLSKPGKPSFYKEFISTYFNTCLLITTGWNSPNLQLEYPILEIQVIKSSLFNHTYVNVPLISVRLAVLLNPGSATLGVW